MHGHLKRDKNLINGAYGIFWCSGRLEIGSFAATGRRAFDAVLQASFRFEHKTERTHGY